MTSAGFPHSDICASRLPGQLRAAFRNLVRPSSSKSGKAFSIRPSLLNLVLQTWFGKNYACFEIVFR